MTRIDKCGGITQLSYVRRKGVKLGCNIYPKKKKISV